MINKLIFNILSIHAYISAFILDDRSRSTIYLNYLDVYLIIFILINLKGLKKNNINISFNFIPLASLLVAVFIISIVKFGGFYGFIEFRPLVFLSFIVFLFLVLGARPSFSWVREVGVSFLIWEIIFIASNYFNNTNKIGIFGELNYDINFMILLISLGSVKINIRTLIFSIVAKTKTFMFYHVLRYGSPHHLKFALIILAVLGFAIYATYDVIDILEFDRIIIAQVLMDVLMGNKEILICGQVLCGDVLIDDRLSWYVETQVLSSSLHSIVPATFHGHFLRSIFLLGLPMTIYLYLALYKLCKRSYSGSVVFYWVVASSISQSIFHHPFVGPLLVLYIAYIRKRNENKK